MDHVDVFEIIGEGPASSAIVDAMIIAGGYLVTTKEHFKKLENAAAKGKGAKP